MIGNDIVDLQQARRDSNWQRPRYLDKLFTTEEQAWIGQAAEPDTMVWLLWSCKEAAYKQWSGRYEQRVFRPREIVVKSWRPVGSVPSGQLAKSTYHCQVVIGEEAYLVQSQVAPAFVHSWTTSPSATLIAKQVFPLKGKQHSQEVRQVLLQYLIAHFPWKKEEISLEHTELGKPLIYHKNQPTELSLSITHHGQYGAFVIETLL